MGFWQGFVNPGLLLSLLPVLSASFAQRAEPPPKLVLFLTIDQARGDYLERFRPALAGGPRELLERGVVFAEAHHHHAATVTAAGHASLATGLYPSRSGIVGNEWFDRLEGRAVHCVEDRDAPILPPEGGAEWPGPGRSPRRLLGTSIGDWLKESSPEAWSTPSEERTAPRS